MLVDMRRGNSPGASQQGSALIMAILLTSLLAALGVGLVGLSSTERLIVSNYRDGLGAWYAAEAGLERALADLRPQSDWTGVLAGAPSSFVDSTLVPLLASGRTLDLVAETAGVQAVSDAAASWGANDPQWRLFAYGPLSALTGRAGGSPAYLAVWIADDRAEGDGDPRADSNGLLLIVARAYGPGRMRRSVAATIQKPVAGSAGLRVLVWRAGI